VIYLLDTNVISDLYKENVRVEAQIRTAKTQLHTLAICQPVYYEIMRGLLKKKATAQRKIIQGRILPRFTWIDLTDADWMKAAEFWADSVNKGKQLSDVDLLLAAMTHRLNATLISSDGDFDALPITRVDWR